MSKIIYILFINGGIAQLARAIGSYPIGRGFKSNFRYHASYEIRCIRTGYIVSQVLKNTMIGA